MCWARFPSAQPQPRTPQPRAPQPQTPQLGAFAANPGDPARWHNEKITMGKRARTDGAARLRNEMGKYRVHPHSHSSQSQGVFSAPCTGIITGLVAESVK